ncbi:HAD family hydrolase [Microbacterium sp. Leaf159]|uniref:HAD family hydrolase n=1 Tax=Microbacterium sp. Leaf159 TaxID=1736279 RepID=UPI000700AE71|nr:HAD family hydrolase [Microbacterium sp. Leaf159]KQR38609.1 haloacid dehalogenase [Microbacterium sp. Leaf159]
MQPIEPIDLVIFDCDGVLVDSERLSIEVDRRVLADLGWPLSREQILHRFVGRSSAHFRAEVEAYLGRPLPDDWESPYQPWYIDAFERDLTAVPGVEAALDEIRVATCVASSGTHAKIRRTLGLTGLLPRFEGRIFSADDVQNGKPDPDLFLHAAEQLGVVPERCAVVEDSRFGVQAARAAGMRVFGYAGGLTPADWLEREGATVFTDMLQLPGLMLR